MMFSEKDMEDSISQTPEKYLGEPGLKLISKQYKIRSYIFDLLFEDRHGAKFIVELQNGTLDRNHTYKILDYYHEYKEKNPNEFIELMVIANRITFERKKRLSDWGVSFKEIPESEFSKIIKAEIPKIQSPIRVMPRGEEKGRVMTSQKATSQKALFDNLKVSLKNNRWSWGGIRADGAVFLRVWEDEKEIKDNREFVRVTDNKRFKNQVAMHPGYKERLDHLARIQNVAKSYMVICVARDVDAIPRVVKYFDSDKLYLGGELMEAGGNIWLEIVRSVPIQDVLLPSP